MKKLVLVIIVLSMACTLQAQPWLQKFNKGPIRLQDVITEWHATHSDASADADEEDVNFQFERWVDYWKKHLDENGYMVSPKVTMREWQAYKAQHITSKTARTTNAIPAWTFQGPHYSNRSDSNGNGLGRIVTAGYHPTDTNTFWVGTAGGGAWKTTDGGNTWTCMTDNTFPVRGVSEIVFNPLNPNTIYICTGDRDAKDCYSFGVLKSYDGGATWDTTGLVFNESAFQIISSMVINKQDTNTLILASNSGMYRSLDGGATFTKTINGNFMQVLYNPIDTNILYAAGSDGATFGVFRSADGGVTWTAPTVNISTATRMAISVTASNPGIVKGITCNASNGLEGFYSSSDTGKTFSRIYNADTSCIQNILSFDPKLRSSSCGGQGWYDLCIAISPLDSNSVYIGGVNTWHSTDGGAHWKISNQWTHSIKLLEVVHADKHYLGYNPINPHYIFEGNDGGIYRSSYRSVPDTNDAIWSDLTVGLHISQFYRIAVADLAPYVLGGAQDNGSKKVIGNDTAYQAGGADGMTCQIDYADPATCYISSQYGSISLSTDSGSSFVNISKHISSPAPSGAWTTPFIIDPVNHKKVYAGYTKLYYTTDNGNNWTAFTGLTGANMDRIAISPVDTNFIYTLAGNVIKYTPDYGTTWKTLINAYGSATDIAVDPNDAKHIWVTYGGYTANKVAECNVNPSSNSSTWHLMNGTLPKIPVNCIAVDHDNNTLYIGTDVGVYYRDRFMSDWALYNNSLPVVEVRDLKINYATGEIWAGTYGRGMWKTAKTGPNLNVSIVPYADNVITVAPNPSKGHFIVSTDNKVLMNKNAKCRLINGLGQTVWQSEGNFNGSKLQIDADGIARGTYVFEVAAANITARTRIVMLQ